MTVAPSADPPSHAPGAGTPSLVLAGASGAEGLGQLVGFVEALPAGLRAAVLIVLHRPVERVSHLREILQRRAKMPVRIAADGDRLEPGVCYIGEPARHLSVGLGGFASLAPDHLYRNRTVDLLFRTAAVHAGKRAIGVVFAGSLSDGADGVAELARAGARILVQDPDTVVHWGMPASAIRSASRAEILDSPEAIAARVVQLLGVGPADGAQEVCAGSRRGGRARA